MSKLSIRGGYGEHGRSCFLVEYGNEGRMYMVDCGIMDTDPNPYPNVAGEELERVDFLFLTHCHKDHSGAFSWFCEQGFSGTLVTSSMTLMLSGISYEKTVILDWDGLKPGCEVDLGPIAVRYGRSGHCPGSLWFQIRSSLEYFLFSGDYQEDTLLYACDPIRDNYAKIALLDCAHRETEDCADELRRKLTQKTAEKLSKGQPVIFPVPHYGRGMEMLCLFEREFPEARICVDQDFVCYAKTMLSEPEWYRKEIYETFQAKTWNILDLNQEMDGDLSKMEFDILLIADAHLKKETNAAFFITAIRNGAAALVTGRVKTGSGMELFLEEGYAERCLYPHHQSYGDLMNMVERNSFTTVLPFHNGVKEVLV